METNNHLPTIPNNGLKKQVKTAFSENKLNQLPVEANTEIRKMLVKLFTLTGLKKENFPDEFQTDVLIEFLRFDLGNFTLAEMELAFRMAMKNEMDAEIDPNHYQSFSAAYIARIMSGYVPIRKRVFDALKSNENAIKSQNKIEYTQAERENIKNGYVLECLIKPWRYYLKTGKLTFGITPFSIIYETLTNDFGVLDLSGDDKKRIHAKAVELVKQKINQPSTNLETFNRSKKINELIQKNGFLETMSDDIKSKCYELSVLEYFEKAKNQNVDLEAVFTQKLKK